MRMWMVDPKILCRKHLLGEHNETHAFLGIIKRKRKASGYIRNNLFEPLSLLTRHDELANEMLNRGMNHKSPLYFNEELLNYLPKDEINCKVNRSLSLETLINRCKDCYNNYMNFLGEIK